MNKKTTTLFSPASMQVREITREDGSTESSRVVEGRAIVFNQPFEYEDAWGDRYREFIAPESCDAEWLTTQDIKINALHNRESTFGRCPGNLQIEVREDGVYFSCEVPKCDIGDRVLELVRAGVYTGCSFEFYPSEYELVKKTEDSEVVYEVTHRKFEALTALTVAMDPAYQQTHVDCREFYTGATAAQPAAAPTGPTAAQSASISMRQREQDARRRALSLLRNPNY